MSKFDEKKYNEAKDKADKFFKKNKRLKTESLGEIIFNSDGFMHLIWKALKKHKRDWKNQIKRFHLLPYAKPVLQGMSHYQEYSEFSEQVMVKKKGKTAEETRLVK